MKANLPELEVKILQFWNAIKLYNQIQNLNRENEHLQFGPPYANGFLHMGHASNIVLKSIINWSNVVLGRKFSTKIGFDTHGLPIELAVQKKISKDNSNFLQECHNFANKWSEEQNKTIDRLGYIHDQNPYYTNKLESIKTIHKSFKKLLSNNYVYLKNKPVPWSIRDETVLADAEIVYKNKKSTSIYVALEILEGYSIKNKSGNVLSLENKFVIIWTTTPWTLIDNVAVTFNPDFIYCIFTDGKSECICEKDSFDRLQSLRENLELIDEFLGIELVTAQIKIIHPFINILVPLIPNKKVEKEGTGFVHTAPAHGLEDYDIGIKYKLPIIDVVNNQGKYLSDQEIYNIFSIHYTGDIQFQQENCSLENKHIFYDIDYILNQLEGKLFYQEIIEHSYPFSDRSDCPIIYKLSHQIFIDIKQISFEDQDFTSYPTRIKEYLIKYIKGRDEWCVSRNRALGVPLALFIDNNEIIQNDMLENAIEEQFSKDFTIFLSKEKAQKFINDLNIKATPYIGVLDVWFDSANVNEIVNTNNIIYLEGKDQYRGWFQSSSILSLLLHKKFAFNKLICHGFVVDSKKEKMSKSKGNGLSLNDFISTHGAELLYLWIGHTEYQEDMVFGDQVIDGLKKTYRKLRNVLRYILGLYKTPDISLINRKIDHVYLDYFMHIKNQYINHLEKYELNKAFKIIYEFIIYLSQNYINSVKNVLYFQDNLDKISIIHTLSYMLKDLLIMLSNFIPFTSEEIYIYISNESIHLEKLIYIIPKGIYSQLNELENEKHQIDLIIDQLIRNNEINDIKKDLIFSNEGKKCIYETSNELLSQYIGFDKIDNFNGIYIK